MTTSTPRTDRLYLELFSGLPTEPDMFEWQEKIKQLRDFARGLEKELGDARTAALREAAEVADTHFENQGFNQTLVQAGFEISAAILSLIDRKEGV